MKGKKRIVMMCVLLCLVCAVMAGCAKDADLDEGQGTMLEHDKSLPPAEEAAAFPKERDLSLYFDGMEGTVVFMDNWGQKVFYNSDLASVQASPCSTFKILSSVMILETGAVDQEEQLTWDGTGWRFPAWNQDIALAEAFRSSCVWYYRQAIDRIGPEYVQQRLLDLSYGNQDISQWEGSSFNKIASADGFWLESSLLISPVEQVEVLKRIFGDGATSQQNVEALKSLMRDESYKGDFSLYGKTGSGRSGWYVGFVEGAPGIGGLGNSGPVYFAVRLTEQDNASGAAAKEILIKIVEGEAS